MRKKIFIILGFVLLILVVLPVVIVSCVFYEKLPTIHLKTKEDLLQLTEKANFVLDNDIDCEGMSFLAIRAFKGNIDGNGHIIHNVNFISENDCFGLIRSIDASESNARAISIKNLGIADFTIDTNYASASGKIYAGGLVGYNGSLRDLTIENCWTSGSIKIDVNNSKVYAGGLIGGSTDGNSDITIKNCYSDVDIECIVDNEGFKNCRIDVGGLVGNIYRKKGGTFKLYNSLFYGSIAIDTHKSISLGSTIYAGSLFGYVESYHDISHCIGAPEYIKVNDFFTDSVRTGGIAGDLRCYGAFQLNYLYYCDYDDETLSAEERKQNCSYYDGTKPVAGNGMKLERYKLLCADFMRGDYSFKDLNGDTKDSFLNFSDEIWNFGYMDGSHFVYPTLKVFD